MSRKHSYLVLTSLLVTGLALGFLLPRVQATWVVGRSQIPAAASPNRVTSMAMAEAVSPASTPASAGRLATGQPLAKAADPLLPPSLPVCSIVPEGTQCIPHVVKRNESVGGLVSHYLPDTVYMRRAELEAAVRQVNGLGSKHAQARRPDSDSRHSPAANP